MISLRLVVDTNIIISAALKPEGLQRTVLLLALTKPARFYVSAQFSKSIGLFSGGRSFISPEAFGNSFYKSSRRRPTWLLPCDISKSQSIRLTISSSSAPMLPVPII
jgi:hypothetical protein